MRFGTFLNNYQETQYWEDTNYQYNFSEKKISRGPGYKSENSKKTLAIYKDI